MLLVILLSVGFGALSFGVPIKDGDSGVMLLPPGPGPVGSARSGFPVSAKRGRDGSLLLLASPEIVAEMLDMGNGGRPGLPPLKEAPPVPVAVPVPVPVYARKRKSGSRSVGVGETVTAIGSPGINNVKGRQDYLGLGSYGYGGGSAGAGSLYPQTDYYGGVGGGGTGGYGGSYGSPSGMMGGWGSTTQNRPSYFGSNYGQSYLGGLGGAGGGYGDVGGYGYGYGQGQGQGYGSNYPVMSPAQPYIPSSALYF